MFGVSNSTLRVAIISISYHSSIHIDISCLYLIFAGMDFHELLDIPHGDRRKYHDDVSVMVVSLEGRIWRSSG